MKQKKAIKLLREGKIQVKNDVENTSVIDKINRKAFPKDKEKTPIPFNFYYRSPDNNDFWTASDSEISGLKIILLSSITNTPTKNQRIADLENKVEKLHDLLTVQVDELEIELNRIIKVSDKSETRKQTDFSIQGQLMISKTGIIVLNSGYEESEKFMGTVVESTEHYKKGCYGNWQKSDFTLHIAPITIQN